VLQYPVEMEDVTPIKNNNTNNPSNTTNKERENITVTKNPSNA
jgi:hypothetical protein